MTWRRLDPTPDPNHGSPLPRSSHVVAPVSLAVDDGITRLLVYGGEHSPRVPISDSDHPRQELWVAEGRDGGAGDWRWISPEVASDSSPPPPARLGHAAAAVGRHVYVFGGRAADGDAAADSDDMYRIEVVHSPHWPFSPEYTVKYTRIGHGGGPCARSYHAMTSAGHSHLYLFGGCGPDGRLADLHRFDKRFDAWTDLGTSSLAGRGGASLMSLDGGRRIAAVAGFAGRETRDSHVYDAAAGGWEGEASDVAGLSPRSVCAAADLPGGTVLFGGEVGPSAREHEGAGSFEDDVVLFDGATGGVDEVIRRDPPGEEGGGGGRCWPRARGWSGAAPAGGDRFYLFGGLAGDDSRPERLGDLWEGRVSR